jgi:hypothetical protein
LVAESFSATELLAAGWTEADLAWERDSELGAEAVAKGEMALAKEATGSALRIARESFAAADPRLGTSLANFAVSLHTSGDTNGVAILLQKALDAWQGTGPWIARMDAPRIARSSLFHMRMESLHRETYRARWVLRWQEIATEAKDRLAALNQNFAPSPEAASEALARWRRERPTMLNDTRKLMAAAFLLLAPSLFVADE